MGLAVSVQLDLRSIRPTSPSRARLVVVLTAKADPNRAVEARPPSRTLLVLDASRSMQGEPLDHVKRSVERMVDMFSADDEVGVVAFSDAASCVVEPAKMDEVGKRLVRTRVSRLAVSANTNIEAGLELGSSLLSSAPEQARRGMILLSDGAPNRGVYSVEGLRDVVKKYRPGISVFALGYGKDHSEDVLSTIGEAGGAGYEYVPDPLTCSRAFARALGAQADVVASGVELVISLADGAELVSFMGKEETRFGKDGVVVTLPDMVSGARRVVVAEIAIAAPGAEKFLARVADVSVRSKEDGVRKVDALDVEVADRDPTLEPSAVREVLLVRAESIRAEARHIADCGHYHAAAASIRRFLPEIETCPGFVLNDGSPLAEAYELLVDEAVVLERMPSGAEYQEFRKTSFGAKVTATAPESARDRGPVSRRFVEGMAGDMPEAYLVNIIDGARHRLREENIIGRTANADIVLVRDSISRRHAEVFAAEGRFLVGDLGSSGGTEVNHERIGRQPRILLDGDVLRFGDMTLRYEEKPRT